MIQAAAVDNSYADSYKKLLDDPLRKVFATDGCSFFHIRKREILIETINDLKLETSKMNWLDLGCGQEDLLTLLSPEFAQGKGCDPSEGMMQNIAGFELVQQPDPQQIPFPDKSFDLVTAVCVYPWLALPEIQPLIAYGVNAAAGE